MPEQLPHPDQRPVGTEADRRPRYRSLRDLTHGPRRPNASRGPQPPSQPGYPPQNGYALPPARAALGSRDTGRPARGRSALRQTLFGALAMLLLVGLGWGGYQAYRYFAPYYGLGYVTGRSGAVHDVQFTVDAARCGLDAVPDSDAKPIRGQFCVVDITATNRSDKDRYVSLAMFSVELDGGARANPTGTAMKQMSIKLQAGEDKDLELVYDIWDGARMGSLKVQIAYETANIPLL